MLSVPLNTAFVRSPMEDFAPQDLDLSLVRLCLNGDQKAFRQLYQRHQQRVRTILYQLCGASTIDDLVQDVFLRAWKGLPRFKQTAKFSTWLYRIAWNVASDQRQDFARSRDQIQTLTKTTAESAIAPDLIQIHYQDLVERGLAQLSLEHRSVLVMHDLQEIPQKDVAKVLGIPTGTVKSRLFHARASLRQFLEREGIQL